ncbi:hypothetical protein LINPERHAP1_LOCUS11481 [Linum perenne]
MKGSKKKTPWKKTPLESIEETEERSFGDTIEQGFARISSGLSRIHRRLGLQGVR